MAALQEKLDAAKPRMSLFPLRPLQAVVGVLEYGAAKYSKGFKRKHELGEGRKNQAKFGARMLPRPWFWPTIERFWEKAPATVEKSINAVLKEYAR